MKLDNLGLLFFFEKFPNVEGEPPPTTPEEGKLYLSALAVSARKKKLLNYMYPNSKCASALNGKLF